MSKLFGNDSSGTEGVPGLTQYDSVVGSEPETLRHDVKWNRRKIVLLSLFVLGFYIPLLSVAITSKQILIIVLTIGIPLLILIFLGLLYWLNRNYG